MTHTAAVVLVINYVGLWILMTHTAAVVLVINYVGAIHNYDLFYTLLLVLEIKCLFCPSVRKTLINHDVYIPKEP